MKQSHDLKNAGNIPKETLEYLANKKAESKGKDTAFAYFIVFVLALSVWLISRSSKKHNVAITTSAKIQPEVHTSAPLPRGVLNSCDTDKAESVLASAGVMAEVQETESRAEYRFRSDWWNTVEPKSKQLMTGIADADACVHKTARLILFEDPSGKEIGAADPINGFSF